MNPAKRRRRNLREHARYLYFDELLERCSNTCHWCRREVARLRDLRADGAQILRVHHAYVIYRRFGRERKVRRATLDHVVALSHGGPNTKTNLVVACWSCNNARSRAQEIERIARETA